MNRLNSEERTYGMVFASLIFLAIFTVIAANLHWGRKATILTAFSIASLKAMLIAFYFMHLKGEKPLVYGIVFVGILAATILLIGIFPDVGLGL